MLMPATSSRTRPGGPLILPTLMSQINPDPRAGVTRARCDRSADPLERTSRPLAQRPAGGARLVRGVHPLPHLHPPHVAVTEQDRSATFVIRQLVNHDQVGGEWQLQPRG